MHINWALLIIFSQQYGGVYMGGVGNGGNQLYSLLSYGVLL